MCVTPGEKAIAGRSLKQIAWRRLKRDKVAHCRRRRRDLLVIVIAVLAPVLTKLFGHPINEFHGDQIDPTLSTPIGAFGGISRDFLLGVEPASGRDVFSRILYGAQTSLVGRLPLRGRLHRPRQPASVSRPVISAAGSTR